MENGFMNKIIGLVLVLVIGATLVGGLLAPVVSGIQDTVGDPVTKTNTGPNDIKYSIVENSEISITNGTNVTVDGATITRTSDVAYLFCTDNAFGWLSQTNSLIFIAGENYAANTTIALDSTKSATISAANGTLTISTGGNTYTSAYNWLLVPSSNGEYVQVLTLNNRNYYLDDSKDVIILGGDYNSGELDTFYWYYNGETKAQGNKTISVAFEKSLVEDTIDIYSGHPVVTITEGENSESFTPYRTFVKAEITGHAPSGTYYVMFGVIGLLGIVLLVTIAANAVRSKY